MRISLRIYAYWADAYYAYIVYFGSDISELHCRFNFSWSRLSKGSFYIVSLPVIYCTCSGLPTAFINIVHKLFTIFFMLDGKSDMLVKPLEVFNAFFWKHIALVLGYKTFLAC